MTASSDRDGRGAAPSAERPPAPTRHRLVIGAQRRLVRLAANATRRGRHPTPPGSTGARPPTDADRGPRRPPDESSSPRRLLHVARSGPGQPLELQEADVDRLLDLVTAAMVGTPDDAAATFTEDAHGWSPAACFSCRSELVALRQDPPESLEVETFTVDRMVWDEPTLVAEWRLVGRVDEPLLVGDDVLVEPGHQRVVLAGVTVAELAGGRIAAVRSYFDDADVIEQAVLDVGEDHDARP
jgi:hypothetical protein